MLLLSLRPALFATKNLGCLVRSLKFPPNHPKMPAGKGNIRSYFSPASRLPTREAGGSSGSQDEDSAKASKRAKTEDEEKQDGDSSAVKKPLSPQQKQMIEEKRQQALEKLQGKNDVAFMGETWKKALQAEFSKDYFVKLRKFVESERKTKTIYPPEKDVFAWTQLCPIQDVKVVILGQDPYHGPNQAHGLCFSVRVGVAAPPSLVNIYKELNTDIDGFEIPDHGYLVGWAQQGVLLLNAVLTVVAHNANSHKGKGWELFTNAVIKWINENLDGVVFILWGGYAQKKGASIDKKRHCVIKGPHPSPLSAHRGFFGCKHFSQANKYLKGQGKKPIDWTSLPKED